MNYNSVRTIHLANLELSRSLGVPYEPIDHSTLNEKHNVLTDYTIPAGEYPNVGYLAIGRGGHRNIAGNGNAALQDVLQHGITDAALFEQIPFRLVEVTNAATGADSLTAAERLLYRIRKRETHNGVEYNAYYLRKITLTQQQPSIDLLITDNGETTSSPFVPSPTMLNPQPVQAIAGNVVTATGRIISTRLPASVVLEEADINHIIEACEIIYGSASFATISEMCLTSGVEVPSSHPAYPEIAAAQCCNFTGVLTHLTWNRDRVRLSYDLGDSSPQLV